jgi:hypothetical protein
MGRKEHPKAEKLTEQVKLNLCESMLREIQDLALHRDQSVSEYIRHVLRMHLYGHAALLPKGNPEDKD